MNAEFFAWLKPRTVPLGLFLAGLALCFAAPAHATRSITLAWNASAQPEVVGYRVYCGSASRSYDRVMTVPEPSTTISGLVEGKTYYFAVAAVGGRGEESMLSTELSFTTPPRPTGTYSGLFYEESGAQPGSSGALTVSFTAGGVYSGRIRIEGRDYAFSGIADEDYRGTSSIRRRGSRDLVLDLKIGTGRQSDKVTGQVTDGEWTALMAGDRAVFQSGVNPAPFAGDYTFTAAGQPRNPTVPVGDSFGVMRVNASGSGRFAGSLADGTKFSLSAPVSRGGLVPFHVSLYSGKGLAIGWFRFAEEKQTDLQGSLRWLKPPDSRARFYPAGFACACRVLGSAYAKPANGGHQGLNLFDRPLAFRAGHPGAGFTNTVVAGTKGFASSDGSGFAMKVSSGTGTFQGRATDPATGLSWPFKGAVLQKADAGYGFLLGSNQTIRVVLEPVP